MSYHCFYLEGLISLFQFFSLVFANLRRIIQFLFYRLFSKILIKKHLNNNDLLENFTQGLNKKGNHIIVRIKFWWPLPSLAPMVPSGCCKVGTIVNIIIVNSPYLPILIKLEFNDSPIEIFCCVNS